jgi:hypothetical protein
MSPLPLFPPLLSSPPIPSSPLLSPYSLFSSPLLSPLSRAVKSFFCSEWGRPASALRNSLGLPGEEGTEKKKGKERKEVRGARRKENEGKNEKQQEKE